MLSRDFMSKETQQIPFIPIKVLSKSTMCGSLRLKRGLEPSKFTWHASCTDISEEDNRE